MLSILGEAVSDSLAVAGDCSGLLIVFVTFGTGRLGNRWSCSNVCILVLRLETCYLLLFFVSFVTWVLVLE